MGEESARLQSWDAGGNAGGAISCRSPARVRTVFWASGASERAALSERCDGDVGMAMELTGRWRT
eukprot:scaffold2229_cov113-Isochrysis_galbana.AAC.3